MAKKKSAMPSDSLIKLLIAALIVLAIPLTVYALNTFRYPEGQAARKSGTTGNGAPSGAHYNLNVHGKPKSFVYDPASEPGGNNIFIPLVGKAQVSLIEGPDFLVIDADGTDGKASFQLPNPDPENDGVTKYSVWVRPLAKPGGKLETTPCGNVPIYDPVTGEQIGTDYMCSVENVVTVRSKGKSKFSDVSSQLLYLYLDLDGDGTAERYPLFDPTFQGTFWDMKNDGSRLVQFRFYPISTVLTTN